MDTPTKWMLILATLSFLLGFVALLSSKIYIDKATNAPLEVDMPFVGKMKTNYPALFFVAVGALIAAYSLKQHYNYKASQQKVRWTISGVLKQPTQDVSDMRSGQLKLVDVGPITELTEDGHYTIYIDLPNDQSFESAVEQIAYTGTRSQGWLVPQRELAAFEKDPTTSKLQLKTPASRVYAPIEVSVTPQTGEQP